MANAWAIKNENAKNILISSAAEALVNDTNPLPGANILANLSGKKVTFGLVLTVASGAAQTAAVNFYPSFDGTNWGPAIASTITAQSLNTTGTFVGTVDLTSYAGVPYWRIATVASANPGTTGRLKFVVCLG